VKESVFSIERKLVDTKEFDAWEEDWSACDYRECPFWVREDAINEDKSLIDPNILRPVARLGGITYAKMEDDGPFQGC